VARYHYTLRKILVYVQRCRHKGDTIAKVLESTPPTVTFIRDLVGLKFVSWNVVLQRLTLIQLMQGTYEFSWNLYENGKFSIDSMYRAQ
jgi:hypothetical protein